MAVGSRRRATLDDLAREDGPAELIGGRIVRMSPTGHWPNQVAGTIYVELVLHVRRVGIGFAYTDGAGFAVGGLASGRESFSPDAAYYDGPEPAEGMKFVPAAPTFAVEVRSEGDRGPAAERAMAAKRADYFEAGTRVVWDVDVEAGVVRSFRADDPDRPALFVRGQVADAEPAVPGWRVAVDLLFGPL